MRFHDFDRYWPASPRPVGGGIRPRAQRGRFGESWWADRFIRVLESFGWSNRLQRGKNYARKGQVLEYQVEPGRVEALVQGTRVEPYRVTIKVKPISHKGWDAVVRAMAKRAAYSATLLAGEMPQDIERAFTEAGQTLFPASVREMGMSCSCPDWANPCKHTAAVYYLLAEEFDRDPFLIFLLRGRSREDIVRALRKHRSGYSGNGQDEMASEPAEQSQPQGFRLPDIHLEGFWLPNPLAGEFHLAISAPSASQSLLKLLSDPPFAHEKNQPKLSLEEIYSVVSATAQDLARQP